MDILLFQIILGIGLFFIINWIGKHSYSIGYMEISIFVKTEEAPALNFLIRVLTPIVYIIIASATLYYFHLDSYVVGIYLVNVYYIAFRLIFNLLTNRGLLLNWNRQFLYWTAIVVISYFTYEKIIKVKANILPDFSTISNELWIIILVFMFQVANNMRFSQDASQKRKDNYLNIRYNHFRSLYGELIKDLTKNEILECITYAILIYEDFNRPLIARCIEKLNFKITQRPHTLGVMQVKTAVVISDIESVRLGTQKIVDSYNKYLKNPTDISDSYFEWSAARYIIGNYNAGVNYCNEVHQLTEIIKNNFFKHTTDKLKPRTNDGF